MSMSDRDGWIWYDGKMVPWREASTHVLTHTLHYGLGVFEGVRAYKTVDGPAIFRLRDHTDRLFRSAQIFGMKIPFTKDELDAYVAKVKAERPEEADYVERRTLPDVELCNERGFAVSLGEWRREIFGVAAPLYRTPSGDCLSVNCGIPSFRFNAEQIERECGPRILGLARSIRSLAANE